MINFDDVDVKVAKESIESKFNDLKRRIEKLKSDKQKIDAVLSVKMNQRAELIEKIKKMGYNPDDLKNQIDEKRRVLNITLNNINKEVQFLEEKIEPMLEAISKM